MPTSRNRVIYPSNGVFVGPSPASGVHLGSGTNFINQLFRVQTTNYNFNATRTDVTQEGQLDPIDQIIVTPPSVGFDISYLDNSVENEARLGFVVDGVRGFISGLLSTATDERNYFFATSPEGIDLIGYSGDPSQVNVVGFGNGYINSYSTQGAVGGLPSTSVNVQALNVVYYTGSSGTNNNIPAIDRINNVTITGTNFAIPLAVSGVAGQISAIQPGNIQVNIGNAALGVLVSDLKIQSYNLSMNFNRQDLNKLGLYYPFTKVMTPPFPATLSIEADQGVLTTGDLHSLLCNDQLYNINVNLFQPSCTGGVGPLAKGFLFKGGKLVSQNTTNSLGPNERVTIAYETRLSVNPLSPRGVFMSGASTFTN